MTILERILKCVGEESLRNEALDLSTEKTLVVLMDMVDGTDLLERGLSNWCSAMVFYYPPDRRIVAAYVGIPDEAIYFAHEGVAGAFKYLLHSEQNTDPGDGNKYVRIPGPTQERKSSGHASVAFYGQQIGRLMSLAKQRTFASYVKKLERSEGGKPKMRIYTLAGNPMMIRVVDGHTRIDAVFELSGQSPHDVVPGAYIAQKAGAVGQAAVRVHVDKVHDVAPVLDRGEPVAGVVHVSGDVILRVGDGLKVGWS